MSRRNPFTRKAAILVLQVAVVLIALGAWELFARLFPSPALPAFSVVLRSSYSILTGEQLLNDVVPSSLRVLIGFLLGVTLGITIGLIIGYFRRLEPWVRPTLEFLRAIPAIALIPAALLLFGPTEGMRIGLIAFGAFFPVLLATIDGARRVDGLLIDSSKIIGHNRPTTLFAVVLPAALPSIFAGIKTALGIALIVMVIAELTAASSGIGFQIQQSQRLFRTADVFGGTLIIGLLGFLFTMAILAIERRVLSWYTGWRGAADK